jgi:hypothetical protein
MSDKTATHLRTILAAQHKELDGQEDYGLPESGDQSYQAHARPSMKPVYALHVIFPNGTVQSFQYQHLDSSSRYLHESIDLRFLGARITHVRLRGRNLWRLYDYMHQHRMAWVQVAARDLAADGETIITGVAIEEPKIPEFDLVFRESVS